MPRSSNPPSDKASKARKGEVAAVQGDDKAGGSALARGIEILRCFGPNERYLSHQDLVRLTGIPKATISRLLGTLQGLGLISFVEAIDRYTVAPGVLSLGYSLLANLDIRELARPYMKDLADHAQASVALAGPERQFMVFLDIARSRAAFTLSSRIGYEIPMESTAMGLAYLSVLPDKPRAELLEQIKAHHPTDWAPTLSTIEEARAAYQKRGFVISLRSWQRDVSAVAAPLVMPDGTIYSLSCIGPVHAMRREDLEDDFGPRLVRIVKEIQGAFGGPVALRPPDKSRMRVVPGGKG